VSNFGSQRLIFKLPPGTFDAASLRAYRAPNVLSISSSARGIVVDVEYNSDEGGGWMDGPGRIDALLPLRNDLLVGDTRLLYLGWLLGVQSGSVPAKAHEPPVPPGLAKLGKAYDAFLSLFEVDEDLLSAAAAASKGKPAAPAKPADAMPLIARLDTAAKDRVLARLAAGDDRVRSELLKMLSKVAPVPERTRPASGQKAATRRTAAELRQAAGFELLDDD
jgi:hypothetical protein